MSETPHWPCDNSNSLRRSSNALVDAQGPAILLQRLGRQHRTAASNFRLDLLHQKLRLFATRLQRPAFHFDKPGRRVSETETALGAFLPAAHRDPAGPLELNFFLEVRLVCA